MLFKMYRNKEFIIYILIMVVCSTLSILSINNPTKYGCVGYYPIIIMFIISVSYVVKRYSQMEELSYFLMKVQDLSKKNEIDELNKLTNSLSLDSFKEGELSILKTEVYKMVGLLCEQKEKLQSDKLYLADSLADISHQLKTPLTSMTIMTDLIDNDSISPQKRRDFINNIHMQLSRLEWLVSTLLKMSKLDAGVIKLNIRECNITSIIEKAFCHLMIPMELKNHTFTTSGDVNSKCLCDENWLVEAVTNIAKNCIEHTQEGGSISVAFEENAIYSTISIEDNGCGIAKEDIPHIFERFYKGQNSSKESVGIGLAFAKQIVVNQNGIIEVSSEEGVGTKFMIKIYKKYV